MQLSKADIKAIRKRLADTDGGIKAAAQLGGITEQAAHKILKGESVLQKTIDSFYNGIEALERAEEQQRFKNSLRAQKTLPTHG